MAYQYPLNGGRINASIGGNSTSAGAGYSLISTGTLQLAGGNNITLSQNGNAITISGGAGGGGGVALYDGVSSITSGAARILASGALTASINGQTLSLNVPSQSSLSATGAISISRTGSTISIGAPIVSLGMFSSTAGGQTAGTSGTVSNAFNLVAGSNITLSQNTNSNGATVSVYGASGGGGGVAIVGGGATYSSGSVNLNASGALTISSGAGQSLNFSAPQTSVFSGTGAISISTNGNTISIGAPAMFDAGISNIGNTSGTSGQNTNGLVLAGGTNITLSQSTNTAGATITILGGGGGGGAAFSAGISTIGNTSGTSGIASNQIIFAGGSNITLSQATGSGGNTLSIIGAASSLVGTNGISISTTSSSVYVDGSALRVRRVGSTTSSATPTINTNNYDTYQITALATNITSFTTNLSGTPINGQTLWITITDNGTSRTITWGSSFEASTIALPTATTVSTRMDVGFIWNSSTSKWRCVAVA